MSYDCYCDYERPEFYSAITRTARRAHRCYECRGFIQPGERYKRVTGKWDGTFDTHATCQRCTAFEAYVREHVKCFCWAFGDLIDDGLGVLAEYNSALPGMWFGGARLVIAARRAAKAGL